MGDTGFLICPICQMLEPSGNGLMNSSKRGLNDSYQVKVNSLACLMSGGQRIFN